MGKITFEKILPTPVKNVCVFRDKKQKTIDDWNDKGYVLIKQKPSHGLVDLTFQKNATNS